MRQVATALIAITWLFLCDTVQAQPGAMVNVGFRNRTDANVLVKGVTIVGGVQKPGQILQVNKKTGVAFENNVPLGTRYYTILDVNTSRILLRQYPVPVQGRDLFFDIVTTPKGIIMLVPSVPGN